MRYLEVFSYFGFFILLAWESSQVNILEDRVKEVSQDYEELLYQTKSLRASFVYIINNHDSISVNQYVKLKKLFEDKL
jgi:hypothetical protein